MVRELRMPGVGYAREGRPGVAEGDLIFGRTEIRFARAVRVRWRGLTGLDLRMPGVADLLRTDFIRPGSLPPPFLVLRLDEGQAVHRFRLPDAVTDDPRERLLTWVESVAPPVRPWPAVRPQPLITSVLGGAALVRAAELGRASFSDPGTVAYRVGVAQTHSATGRHGEAIALLTALAERCVATYGSTGGTTLHVRNELAKANFEAGVIDEAIEIWQRVLPAAEQVHGTDGDETLAFRNNLAMAYQAFGAYRRAIALFETNLRLSARRLGETHPDTLGRHSNLAGTHAMAGARRPAVQAYWQVLDLLDRRAASGELAATVRRNLATLHSPEWGTPPP